jgi:hypothetical protein
MHRGISKRAVGWLFALWWLTVPASAGSFALNLPLTVWLLVTPVAALLAFGALWRAPARIRLGAFDGGRVGWSLLWSIPLFVLGAALALGALSALREGLWQAVLHNLLGAAAVLLVRAAACSPPERRAGSGSSGTPRAHDAPGAG